MDEAKDPKIPRGVILVENLESLMPGMIFQMAGLMTTMRYQYATVYMDQASWLSCVYPQKKASVEETLKIKDSWERYSSDRVVTIKPYHTDTSILKFKKWVESCHRDNQCITSAGVNAHNQNEMSESHIRYLKELALTMLIKSIRGWPKCM